jgi:DNA repair photolyase
MIIKEIKCKGILSKSGLADYALNCYTGCQHGCRYCYARFMGRFIDESLPWGGFVHVKVNAAEVLKRQVQRVKKGEVFISSVCDGWQPLEEKYQLTRQCLETLLDRDFPVTILTKSTLVTRDLDILSKKKELVDIGVTITTLEEDLARDIEPGAPPPQKRLKVLEKAGNLGLTTYAFLGPLMPCLSDTEDSIQALFKAIKPLNLSYLYVDMLNPRWGVWPSLKTFLVDKYPSLVGEYQRMLFHQPSRVAYSQNFRAFVQRLAHRHDLEEKVRFCF